MQIQLRGSDLPFIPPQASHSAGGVDLLVLGITLVSLVFSAGIFGTVLYFVVRYRKGRKVDRHQGPINHLPIEAAWTLIPAAIGMGLYIWSGTLFLQEKHVSADASPIYVVGKQWMWKVQHPDGRWEINTLHVPLGRPIVLVLTSEDVIHSFYVPAFRVKQDAIPGVYTRMPFTPTRIGDYHLFCAEFCGTFHSTMIGVVTVMSPTDYARWLTEGNREPTVAAQGETLFRQFGCSGCHEGGSVRAPRLEGIYGNLVPVQIPRPGLPLERTPAQMVLADEQYLHDSIVLPGKEIAAGYPDIMPSFKNRITEAQILQIIAYLRSLASAPAPPAAAGGAERTQHSPEEYRARTGFVPPPRPSRAGENTRQNRAPQSNPATGAIAPGEATR